MVCLQVVHAKIHEYGHIYIYSYTNGDGLVWKK